MGQFQKLWAEIHSYADIEQQKWFIEACEGAYDARRDGNEIKIHLYDVESFSEVEQTPNFKRLEERNISCGAGYDYLYYIRIGYDFKNHRPRRKNSRKEIILD